ncbi:MAG: carboxypeptidase-like regulatory domain-containing protein, partial [Candidatus Sericytochromatia bacterium]|nr:carboxypeptidase-like regulatory domain-containing protein [Candidatus Sericytochromatia bacterium]
NPLVNVDRPDVPKPPVTISGTDGCERFGPDSPSFVIPAGSDRVCPMIYPPPPGCDAASLNLYGEFAGLRAPAEFRSLPDGAAVRGRLREIYTQSGGVPMVGTAGGAMGAPGSTSASEGTYRLKLTPPLAKRRMTAWECLQTGYPELAQAFLDGEGPVSPPPPPEPPIAVEPQPDWPPVSEPWFPVPCVPGPSQTVVLSGHVFDEQGVPFRDEVEVRVASRDFGFLRDVTVVDGRFEVPDAPAGVRLEVTVRHVPSGESRRRFVTPLATFQDCGQPGFATLNFGGTRTDTDPLGHRYPLAAKAPVLKQEPARLKGEIYDLTGKLVPDAAVTLLSLGAQAVKLQTRTSAERGAYSFEAVPADEAVELTVSHPDYLPVVRTLPPVAAGDGGYAHFGGKATREDPLAPQFALVKRLQEAPAAVFVSVGGKVRAPQAKVQLPPAGVVRLEGESDQGPFKQEAKLDSSSNYTFDKVPARLRGTLTVEAPGYEKVMRLVRVGRQAATFHFGASDRSDPQGDAYGLVEKLD